VTCFRPLEGWRCYAPNESGRYPITFRMHAGAVDRPVDVPCGKCAGCLRDRANAWGIRCYHESLQHERNSFLTLTYRDPAPETLSVDDCQRFFKRLRKRYKFRYFLCGEFGSRTMRPHYHMLCFGEDFRDGSEIVGYDPKSKYYYNREVENIWGHGQVTLAPLMPETAFYTTGYSLKSAGQEGTFHLASRRPYIGQGWLAANWSDISRNGFVTINGDKMPVPKSYLLRPEFAFEFEELKASRTKYVDDLSAEEKWSRKVGLRNKERNLVASLNVRSREL